MLCLSLDLPSTNLTNISDIYDNLYEDYIKGSDQYNVFTNLAIMPIYGGIGDDTFYENGTDQIGETRDADTIDGGNRSNVYYESGAKSSYTPGLIVNEVPVFHNGTTWSFFYAAGMQITLTNTQKVGFTDQTLYSGRCPGPIRSQLQATMLFTSGGISNLLGRIEQQGLIRRTTDPSDKRAVRVELTRKGLEIVDLAMVSHAAAERGLCLMLSQPEQDVLARLLSRMGLLNGSGLGTELAAE